MRRRHFLSSLGAASLAVGSGARADAQLTTGQLGANDRLTGALVLSGGGARGCYEAGVIKALVDKAGVRDGQPIPGIDVVCGASIGALNGWMVATAQYSRLEQLWKSIGAQTVFELKHQYAAIPNPESGVGTRVGEALSLFHGLLTNVRGVMDDGTIKRWIDSEINPATPLVVPLLFSVTNLDRGSGELFFRPPANPLGPLAEREQAAQIIKSVTAGTLSHLATDDILQDAIRASAALPIVLDPVMLPGPDGPESFVDGGIANNTPVDVARAIAKTVYVIFLDPKDPPPTKTANALEVGIAAFGVTQHRVIEVALRSAYVESNLKRELAAASNGANAQLLNQIFDVDLFVIHPREELPVKVSDFTDQAKLDEGYQLGYERGMQGWAKYDPTYD